MCNTTAGNCTKLWLESPGPRSARLKRDVSQYLRWWPDPCEESGLSRSIPETRAARARWWIRPDRDQDQRRRDPERPEGAWTTSRDDGWTEIRSGDADGSIVFRRMCWKFRRGHYLLLNTGWSLLANFSNQTRQFRELFFKFSFLLLNKFQRKIMPKFSSVFKKTFKCHSLLDICTFA